MVDRPENRDGTWSLSPDPYRHHGRNRKGELIRDRLLAALRSTGALSVADLDSELRVGRRQIQRHLAYLIDEGLVEREPPVPVRYRVR